MGKITVLLADDHQIVLDGLRTMLEKEQNIEVVGLASNGHQALRIISGQKVDIAVLDIEMPDMDGIEVTKKIRLEQPETKVLILSMYSNDTFIKKLIELGVSGYILKNQGQEELVTAINRVAIGDEYFGESVTKAIIKGMKKSGIEEVSVKLTQREIEVLKLIGFGMSTPEIAEKLFIAHSTVETHRRNLIDKTGVANSKGLIRYALKNGYTN